MGVKTCPCCLRPLPGSFVVDLDTNHARRWDLSIKLTPQAAELLHALCAANGRTVSRERLKIALWGHNDADWPDYPDNTLSIYVGRLRRMLQPLGVRIQTIHSTGVRAIVEDNIAPQRIEA